MKVDFPDPSAPNNKSSNTTLGFCLGLDLLCSGSGGDPDRQQHRLRIAIGFLLPLIALFFNP